MGNYSAPTAIHVFVPQGKSKTPPVIVSRLLLHVQAPLSPASMATPVNVPMAKSLSITHVCHAPGTVFPMTIKPHACHVSVWVTTSPPMSQEPLVKNVPVIWLLISPVETDVSHAPEMKFLTPTCSVALLAQGISFLTVTTPLVNVLQGSLRMPMEAHVFVLPPMMSLLMAHVQHAPGGNLQTTTMMPVFVLPGKSTTTELANNAPVTPSPSIIHARHVSACKYLAATAPSASAAEATVCLMTTTLHVFYARTGKSPMITMTLVFVPQGKS